jgi:hypothetical protein
MSIGVLIADDQELIRTGLAMILDAQPEPPAAPNNTGKVPPHRHATQDPQRHGDSTRMQKSATISWMAR